MSEGTSEPDDTAPEHHQQKGPTMAITLVKPNYVVFSNGYGQIVAIEPRLATEAARDEQAMDATVHCLRLHEVTATDPADATAQVRAELDAEEAAEMADQSPDTPAEAALRDLMARTGLDRI
jgi:hypothetical protein